MKQMEPNSACGGFGDGKSFYDGSRPLPPPEGGAPIQMKHKFLHNSRTNQANGTKFGMWGFLGTGKDLMIVRDPSLSGRAPILMKHKFLHNSRTKQANGTKFGMWGFS